MHMISLTLFNYFKPVHCLMRIIYLWAFQHILISRFNWIFIAYSSGSEAGAGAYLNAKGYARFQVEFNIVGTFALFSFSRFENWFNGVVSAVGCGQFLLCTIYFKLKARIYLVFPDQGLNEFIKSFNRKVNRVNVGYNLYLFCRIAFANRSLMDSHAYLKRSIASLVTASIN